MNIEFSYEQNNKLTYTDYNKALEKERSFRKHLYLSKAQFLEIFLSLSKHVTYRTLSDLAKLTT